MIQPYTSRTDTGEILDMLHEHGWRVLVGPHRCHNSKGLGYALENGMAQQTSARGGEVQHRENWEPHRYHALLERLGAGADWAVVPDVVGDGVRSMTRTYAWIEAIRKHTLPLVAVQDGMEPGDVWPLVGPGCGIFVGGSTEWKWTTLPSWGQLARRRGCYLHVGRVNSAEKIMVCRDAGAHSFDGRCPLFDRDRIPALTRAALGPYSQKTIFDVEVHSVRA